MSSFASLRVMVVISAVFSCSTSVWASSITSGSVVRQTHEPVYVDHATGYTWRGPTANHQPGSAALEQYPGYRFPTRGEVVTFLDHFGFPLLPDGFDDVDVDPARADLFREMTHDGTNVFGTYQQGELLGRIGISAGDTISVEPATLALTDSIDFEGHWLVQIPEPATAVHSVVGVALLVAAVRRRRRQYARQDSNL